ncbi:unnamed protein product [Blepharisma stoltei]|uniref:Enoyl reductase (ER) domain-containing protein n=1 Tax=Blepharisma stoltei TaxID=1481888 RepID=A0AAU9JXC7_9CILI|nr:unnamed protein product [Blepharisma stoltei]
MMRAVTTAGFGDIDVLQVSEIPRPIPGENEVLVKIHASALNRADTLQRKGLYPPPPGASNIIGLECTGEVAESVGSWASGKRVMSILSGGGYAEYATIPSDHLIPIPDNLSYEEAAAIPEGWITAYQILFYIAKGKPQEKVLIHAGASGVGTALIQLAKLKGLLVAVTCGSQEKMDFCRNLGADLAINYKTESFKEKIRDFGGVDIVLDCIGANYFEDNLDAINLDGRWIIYGTMGGHQVNQVSLRGLMAKRVSLITTTLRSRSKEYKADLIKEFINDGILDAFQNGILKPILYRTFSMEEVALAHELMEKNENSGKIVLKIIS